MKRLLPLILPLASCGGSDVARREERLRDVAAGYVAYGLVDDLLRWSPELCAMPPPPAPRVSAAAAGSPHGRKLYHLYAKDWDAYTKGGVQPAGQVVVKEAWEPPASPDGPRKGAKQGLYVMMKTGEADGDGGWVYGTLLPDGRTVTASGRLASCMACHREAPADRLFGLKDVKRRPGSIDPHR